MAVLIAIVLCCLTKTVYAQSPCTTPNQGLAKCIPIKECKSFVDVLKVGVRPPSSVLDFMRESSCGFDNGPLVCCGNFNHPVESTPPNADPRKHKNFHLLPKNCGFQEVDDRVLGVEVEAQLEEFPWMALLEYNLTDAPRNNFFCGGTLINNQYVLTIASCVIIKTPFSVRLGEHDLTREIDCRTKIEENQKYELCINSYEDIPIKRIIRHVDFNDREKENNIALIRLARPATISTNIRPICLPLNGEESPPGRVLFVAGWGRTDFVDDGHGSNIKRKAQLPIVALDKCKQMYSGVRRKTVKITEQHLCAGGEVNVDACQGDGGNGLVTPKVGTVPPQWYVEGIVSFGVACGFPTPSVFTRVSSYLNWILDHIEE